MTRKRFHVQALGNGRACEPPSWCVWDTVSNAPRRDFAGAILTSDQRPKMAMLSRALNEQDRLERSI